MLRGKFQIIYSMHLEINFFCLINQLNAFFLTHGSVHHDSMLIKVQLDATVCRHLFTATSLYMFRASPHPSSGVLKTVSATSGISHGTGTATSFHRGLISF